MRPRFACDRVGIFPRFFHHSVGCPPAGSPYLIRELARQRT
jgi:hypothetical protein